MAPLVVLIVVLGVYPEAGARPHQPSVNQLVAHVESPDTVRRSSQSARGRAARR